MANKQYTDTEMLDWLESKNAGVNSYLPVPASPWWVNWLDGDKHYESNYHRTPREAITAAMNGEAREVWN